MSQARLNLALLLVGPAVAGCDSGTSRKAWAPAASGQALRVAVSILPAKYFVERIAGTALGAGRQEGQEGQEGQGRLGGGVSVLVGPGQSPATYEPTPRQMADLEGARLYFRIGVAFEDAWLDRIVAAHPGIEVVDLRQGIELRPLATDDDHLPVEEQGQGRGRGRDPHVWMSPRTVGVMAATIRDALIKASPSKRQAFESNYQRFLADLEALDREITELLSAVSSRKFLAFHPAWGYLADDYGLDQIPIETAGKEPGAKALAQLIDRARMERIRVVVVQAQFSTTLARTVAEAIDAHLVSLDPLAEDYLANMRTTARTLSQALGGEGHDRGH